MNECLRKSRLWRDLRFLDTISFSFFLCVEGGRTHKDIRLELAPLSAHRRKFFLGRSYPHFLFFSIVYVEL
ncbi:MAG: hypothetical protein UY24_C0032G0006 [Parcubacteria group bacterium GW2011_GWA1_48_11b]|nr:MAG: hypothetical protein UY24_C0032G0006 [Parcubacteria group bacterium GW2011_GWA1_48_11b]